LVIFQQILLSDEAVFQPLLRQPVESAAENVRMCYVVIDVDSKAPENLKRVGQLLGVGSVYCIQGRIQPVSLRRAISVTIGSQVS